MDATVTPPNRSRNGRVSARLADTMRSSILTGEIGPGDYLPTERELSALHGLARKTVASALARLTSEGLIVAEPRHGYRVLARAADPDLGCPLAYLPSLKRTPENWYPLHQEMLAAFRESASRQSWPMLGFGVGGNDAKSVIQQIKAARVSGLIIDALDRDILDAVRHEGLPTVAVDCAEANLPVDTIVQDSYTGGILAAEYLVERGHDEIAWIGPTAWSPHSLARVSGTAAGLIKHGRFLERNNTIECERDSSDEAVRALLARKDRPTGIVALYQQVATNLVKAAREMGLTIGKDLEIVGWVTEQQYERDWLPLFQGGPVAPAVVWSPRRMADLAIERIEAHRKTPNLPPIRITVPVELRIQEEK